MPVKGQTGATTSLDLKTSVEFRPTEISLSLGGKIVVALPSLKIKLSEISIIFFFLPLLRISGFEITTEPAKLEVNLSGTTIETRLEKATRVEVITSGEIKAKASVEESATVTLGPFRLQA